MKSGVFDKKAFIQSVRDNLKNLYRKTLAVSYTHLTLPTKLEV